MEYRQVCVAKTCLSMVFLTLSACGGGGGSAQSSASVISSSAVSSSVISSANSTATESSSSSISSSSSQSSASSLLGYNGTYCGNFTAINDRIDANNYTFLAPEGSCFGIVNDGASRKTLPLEVLEIGSILQGVTIEPNIKVLLVQGNTLNNYLSISFEVSNASNNSYCSVTMSEGIHFYDEGNQLLPAPGPGKMHSWLTGATYRNGSNVDTHCLGPGDKFYLAYDQTAPLPEGKQTQKAVFDAAASVQIPYIGALNRTRPLSNRIPSLQPVELAITRNGSYPRLRVTFTNTTGSRIRLTEDYHSVLYFDDEDYFVNSGHVWLSEELGVEAHQLTEDDYFIAAGESFSLADTILDIAAVKQGTATKAVVQLQFMLDPQ